MPALFDRDAELRRLRALLDDARTGAGQLALVKGSPGGGKSALLEELVAEATSEGFRELRARGGEFEQEFTFGVVRQLVEPVLSKLDDEERARVVAGPAVRAADVLSAPGGDPVPQLELFHSLYWLCANLAAEAPLVIVIDDAQWADAPSLDWLRYLARRLEHLPVLIVMTAAA